MDHLRLAWRNVWRNRRRTLITIISIGSGLAALLFGQSLVKTIQYQLVEKATGVFTGHLQVVSEEVRDLKIPEAHIEDPAVVEKALLGMGDVAAFQRRIMVTGLASSKTESAGVLVCGVEPARDRRVLKMHSYLKEGRHLDNEAWGPSGAEVFLGRKLLDQLGLALGDELVLMASSEDGSLAAELFRISGVFESGSHTFDASIVYVHIDVAEQMLGLHDQVSNFVIRTRDPLRLRVTAAQLRRRLTGQPVRVVTWEEVDSELVGIREYQDALLGVVLLVVFIIVALGILNTLLMSMFERVREFGLLIAIGARPAVIRGMVLLESCLMGLLGAGFGLALGGGLILYYRYAGFVLPVGEAIGYFMPFDSVLFLRFHWPSHLTAVAAVFLTSALSGLPPAVRASRMHPADSLRQI